jgi:hypothetical protein
VFRTSLLTVVVVPRALSLVGENLLFAAVISHGHGALMETVEFLLKVGGARLGGVTTDRGQVGAWWC